MRFLISAILSGLAAMAEMPAPGSVTFDVDANLKQRSWLPASRHASAMSRADSVGLEWVQVMDAVGVVPEDAEIVSSAGHGRQTTNDILGIGDAAGVGVLRNAPDTLHGIVLGDDSLDLIHVGAAFVHLHGNHLDAERFRDAEVTVVTRNGADPLDSRILRPGFAAEGAGSRGIARRHCPRWRQARVPPTITFSGVSSSIVATVALRLGKTIKHAVVATVGAVLGDAILRAGNTGEQWRLKSSCSALGLPRAILSERPFALNCAYSSLIE